MDGCKGEERPSLVISHDISGTFSCLQWFLTLDESERPIQPSHRMLQRFRQRSHAHEPYYSFPSFPLLPPPSPSFPLFLPLHPCLPVSPSRKGIHPGIVLGSQKPPCAKARGAIGVNGFKVKYEERGDQRKGKGEGEGKERERRGEEREREKKGLERKQTECLSVSSDNGARSSRQSMKAKDRGRGGEGGKGKGRQTHAQLTT